MSVRSVSRSIAHAMRGLQYIYVHEQNFRIQLWIAFFVLGVMVWLDIAPNQQIIVLLLIATVLTLEVLNSVLEKFVDIIKPRLAYQVQVVKDMMAAMVLIASFFSIVIGILILAPPFLEIMLK
ncbi:MAG: diacylglycerol kinase [Candidatus Magasanikbacteria bacterium CG10_big_fil_rev_8_21_14_0_10_47_10]|uniref:Diacylglycerol kinase n=1 Tax=Candidatus Magasanikbacteria bacterium CG10_big_fil_rev_8_21_14_0_10_47_10 TaxID=1974652 RepID=A0A2H0TT48_9BACT|nr:MAG: diacylglycerol kinase [Candidatus Magasanikbacteria bacterium CG10_big_fil_rev_8_21_14_0_10_47_10]